MIKFKKAISLIISVACMVGVSSVSVSAYEYTYPNKTTVFTSYGKDVQEDMEKMYPNGGKELRYTTLTFSNVLKEIKDQSEGGKTVFILAPNSTITYKSPYLDKEPFVVNASQADFEKANFLPADDEVEGLDGYDVYRTWITVGFYIDEAAGDFYGEGAAEKVYFGLANDKASSAETQSPAPVAPPAPISEPAAAPKPTPAPVANAPVSVPVQAPVQPASSAVKDKFVLTGDLNVRTEPNTGSAIITALKKNTYPIVIEKTGNWYKIDLGGGKTGFISASYVKDLSNVSAPAASVSKTVNVPAVNVRSSASTSDTNKIGVLKQGETVNVVGNEKGWDKIQYQGGFGYVDARYLSK